MLEATITKAVVIQDQKTGGTVLMGVAEYFEDRVNFTIKYDWDTLDIEVFCEDLTEKLAQDFDLPTNRVDIRKDLLLARMKHYGELNKRNIN